MKNFLVLLVFCLLAISCETHLNKTDIQTEDTNIDLDLVKKYGADAYGMKQYVMAFLKKGTNESIDSIERSKLQRAHLDNITTMAKEGKLVLAGPFLDNGELRGIYIFNVTTVAEAEALTNSDPSIQAGVLAMELKPWYGSAALIAVNDIHKKIAAEGI
jgi:uncharacterized protein YciI